MRKKIDLINKIATINGLSKAKATELYDSVLQVYIEEIMEHGSLRLQGFGNFSVVRREAREYKNPRNGDVVSIPAQKRLRFKASQVILRDLASLGDKEFESDSSEEE